MFVYLFVSELLHRLHEELCQSPPGLTITLSHPFRDVVALRELLPSLFQGELSSEVRTFCTYVIACMCMYHNDRLAMKGANTSQ